MIEFEKIFEKVITNLDRGLPSWLTYHNVNHTKYVLQKAEEIAKEEKVSERELYLIKTAALYHDTGFLVDHKNHEERSCKIFSTDSKIFKFSTEEVEKICSMILATCIPQKPKILSEKIVADADLEYLGTTNFDSFSKNLYRELQHLKPDLGIRKWDELQINFLSNHTYHTDFCKVNKEPEKQRNLELVKERLLAHKK